VLLVRFFNIPGWRLGSTDSMAIAKMSIAFNSFKNGNSTVYQTYEGKKS